MGRLAHQRQVAHLGLHHSPASGASELNCADWPIETFEGFAHRFTAILCHPDSTVHQAEEDTLGIIRVDGNGAWTAGDHLVAMGQLLPCAPFVVTAEEV